MPDVHEADPEAAHQPAGGAAGFAVVVACATVCVNFLLILVAAVDRSWLAFGIQVMFSPLTNGIIAMVSFFCVPVFKCRAEDRSTDPYLVASIGVPLIGASITFFAINVLKLQGC